MFQKIKKWVLSNKWWSVLIFVIIIIAIYFIFFHNKAAVQIETVSVERRSIREVVSTTGNVKPFSEAALSFEKGGRVSDVSVFVGEKVFAGEYLASVSNADLVAQVEQAKAGLKSAQANLDSLNKGSTPEQIAVQESQVEKASVDLSESNKSLSDSINDVYTKADDSIRNKVDILFDNPRNSSAKLKFNPNNFQLQNDIEQGRVNLENIFVSWNKVISDLSTSIDTKTNLTKSNLDSVSNFLDEVASAVNDLNPNDSGLAQATVDAWKNAVSIARSNVSLAISTINSVINQNKIASSALKIVQNQLALVKMPATSENISSSEALVEQAQANLDNANAQLAKSVIRSPINGIVKSIDAKVGEVTQIGTPSISVISSNKYEIESFVAEADIAKITIGDLASTTLDAYGSDTFFDTRVIKIDPAETVVDGVSTYKVTFNFVNEDERIKSGMTANLDILTGQKDGVSSVPTRSVYTVDNKKVVRIIDPKNSKNTIEKEVRTGLRGVDGYIEITSGLNEGEKVVASPVI